NLDDLGDRGTLLADRVVNADQIVAFAVDDGVEGNGGLAGLAIADDEFALAAANGDHAVYRLQSGGHGFTYRLTVDNARSNAFQCNELVGRDGPLVVDGLTKRVHDATYHRFAHGHAHDATGALDLVTFLDLGVFAEQHHANLIFFQVHRDAGHAVGEGKQFASHDLIEAIDARNAVAQGNNCSGLVHGDLGVVVLDLLADQFRNFVCFDLCHKSALSL